MEKLPFDVYQILGYGVIGLGAVFAFLAYRLLANEQKRDAPRNSILKQIHAFMVMCIVLCVIGGAAEVTKNLRLQTEKQKVAQVTEDLSTTKVALETTKKKLDGVSRLASFSTSDLQAIARVTQTSTLPQQDKERLLAAISTHKKALTKHPPATLLQRQPMSIPAPPGNQ